MALQSKTLLNDLGSAVVAEIVAQLNVAEGYIKCGDHTWPAAGAANSTVLCGPFNTDVLVTSVRFEWDANEDMDQDTSFVALSTRPLPAGGSDVEVVVAEDFSGSNNFTTGVPAGYVSFSDILAACAAPAGSLPMVVPAGSTLVLDVNLKAGDGSAANACADFCVSYRPVKDALNMQPAFTPKMANFKSVAR